MIFDKRGFTCEIWKKHEKQGYFDKVQKKEKAL